MISRIESYPENLSVQSMSQYKAILAVLTEELASYA